MAPQRAVRRNGATTSKETSESSKPTSTSSSTLSTTTSSLMPTSLETLLLLLYPAILLLGSIFSLLEPHARVAPYNTLTQSHPAEFAPSYFALKRNFLNTYFVKVNWFWVSLAYIIFLFLHRINGPPGLTLTPRRLRGLVRYVVASTWWVGVTQWFFGPALVDRGFRITGGACELADRLEGTGGARELVSAKACKAVGGMWRGGHDISGHVFILVLGSAFLVMEVLPLVMAKRGVRDERAVKGVNGEVVRIDGGAMDAGLESGEEEGTMEKVGAWMPVGVAALSWWMLLMTAAYFHTWFEKLTGLLTAFAALFTIFLLPRAMPAMRDVVGIPGS